MVSERECQIETAVKFELDAEQKAERDYLTKIEGHEMFCDLYFTTLIRMCMLWEK